MAAASYVHFVIYGNRDMTGRFLFSPEEESQYLITVAILAGLYVGWI